MTEPRYFRDEKSFGIYNDAGEVIARNHYRDVEQANGTKQRVFPSIHVRPDHRHVGLAGRLTKHSLDVTIDEGYCIVPICPYIVQWIRDHDDGTYQQHLEHPVPEHFRVD